MLTKRAYVSISFDFIYDHCVQWEFAENETEREVQRNKKKRKKERKVNEMCKMEE